MSNIHRLNPVHPDRQRMVRAFCAEQIAHFEAVAARPEGSAAALSVVITGDLQVLTHAAALEPIHAAALLEALDEVRAWLQRHLGGPALALVGTADHSTVNVVPMVHQAP